MSVTRARPRLLFIWEKFAPYHMDRCEACARDDGKFEVFGVEVSNAGGIYQWDQVGLAQGFRKITLFPDIPITSLGWWRYFRGVLAACLRSRADYVFLCGFQSPAIFLAAVVLRLLGFPTIVMQDSKYDDKPRFLTRECLKSILYKPYSAALVGSRRSAQYLEFLGMTPSRIVIGYDTIALDRVRKLAGAAAGAGGTPHAKRHFTIIARFVPEKNLGMALTAYAFYRRRHCGTPRDLHLCGWGALEQDLREQIARQKIEGVRFRGYMDQAEIAATLATTLALILPSISEPFGLVVNEGLSLGVPIIVSENCGARDLLVRTGVNGYFVEPNNPWGLAHFMGELDRDQALWERLSANARLFQERADTAYFVAAVEQITGLLSEASRKRTT